jgi:hypothetical protein
VYLGRILALSQILTSGNERVGSLLLGESDELDRMEEEATGDEGTSFLQSGLDCCLPGLPDLREPLLLIVRQPQRSVDADFARFRRFLRAQHPM